MDRFEAAEERTERRHLFERLRTELDSHSQVEETVFYPFFEKREEFVNHIADSYDDHQEMRELVEDLDSAFEESTDEELEDVFDDLVSCIQGHVDEEETELFTRIEEICTIDQLDTLGEQMELAREHYDPKPIAA